MGTRESHSGRETRTRRVKDKQSIQAYGRVREAGGYLKILPDSQLCSQNILILTLMSAYSSAMIRGNQQLQTFGPIVYWAAAAANQQEQQAAEQRQPAAAYCSCQQRTAVAKDRRRVAMRQRGRGITSVLEHHAKHTSDHPLVSGLRFGSSDGHEITKKKTGGVGASSVNSLSL